MIIVLGKVQVPAHAVPEALALGQAHVMRSRQEPGCLSHQVMLDPLEPHTLAFVEEWQDRAALMQHFQVPASHAFVKAISALATARPSIRIFEAAEMAMP